MGVVRGLGYQKYGAIITFVSFMCIGTSSCLLLIFIAHLKVPGRFSSLLLREFITPILF